MNGATLEEVSATIADYERLAIGTGEWRGTEVSFSNDALAWAPHLPPTADNPTPLLARAIVHREGVTVPTSVVLVWAENVPNEPEWAELWHRKPHALFGAAAVRAGLRRAFRDVIGDRAEPSETGPVAPSSRPVAPAAEPRDWLAAIADAQTAEEVNTIKAEARAARAVTIPIEKALRARLAELKDNPGTRPAVADAPATDAPPAPAEAALPAEVAPEVAEVEAPKPSPPARREPAPETAIARALREAQEDLAANPAKHAPAKPSARRKRTKGGAA